MSVLAQIKGFMGDSFEAPVEMNQQRFLQMHWAEFLDTPRTENEKETYESASELNCSAAMWRPGPIEDSEPME